MEETTTEMTLDNLHRKFLRAQEYAKNLELILPEKRYQFQKKH